NSLCPSYEERIIHLGTSKRKIWNESGSIRQQRCCGRGMDVWRQAAELPRLRGVPCRCPCRNRDLPASHGDLLWSASDTWAHHGERSGAEIFMEGRLRQAWRHLQVQDCAHDRYAWQPPADAIWPGDFQRGPAQPELRFAVDLFQPRYPCDPGNRACADGWFAGW